MAFMDTPDISTLPPSDLPSYFKGFSAYVPHIERAKETFLDYLKSVDRDSLNRWMLYSLGSGALLGLVKVISLVDQSGGTAALSLLVQAGHMVVFAKAIHELTQPLFKSIQQRIQIKALRQSVRWAIPGLISFAATQVLFSILPKMVQGLASPAVTLVLGVVIGAATRPLIDKQLASFR